MKPFDHQVHSPGLSVVYHLAMFPVAAAMLLLPLIYIGLIAAAGYGVYWYALHGLSMFSSVRGAGAAKVLLFVYVLPLIVGVVMIVFMVKPLFARKAEKENTLILTRSEQPIFFEFVDRLARCVGAPSPRQIEVDCAVNAHARFRNGLFSIPTRDLVLRVGLPLVSNLSLRGFTGVLAHELGHFAQRGGMSLTYIIRSINGWFARVVYQRDSLDMQLEDAAHNSESAAIQLIANVARLFVWLSRRVLWVLMIIGHGLASMLLRQMEFDADRYETLIAGSDDFAKTSHALTAINIATRDAYDSVGTAWAEKRLPDNLPKLIAVSHGKISPQGHKKIDEIIAGGKTGWFDTHPADAQRVAAAKSLAAPGLFQVEGPATELFKEYDELAKRVTLAHYFELIGRQVQPQHLTPVEEVITADKQQTDNFTSLHRYTQGTVHPVALVSPKPIPAVPRDLDDATSRLLDLRNALLEKAPAARKAMAALAVADSRAAGAQAVRTLKAAGVSRIDAKSFGLQKADDAELAGAVKQAEQLRAAPDPALREVQSISMERLALALSLESLTTNPSAGVVPEVDEYDIVPEADPLSSAELVRVLRLLAASAATIRDVSGEQARLGVVLARIQGTTHDQALIDTILSRSRKLHASLKTYCERLPTDKYPYKHSDKDATLRSFLAPNALVPADYPGELYQFAAQVVDNYYTLYGRMLSDLVKRAEEIEAHIGFGAMPEVKDEDEAAKEKA